MSKRDEKFPGFQECLRLMRKHDPQAQEDGFHALLPHAADWVEELRLEFEQETDRGLRCWLLELLAEARSPQLLPLFVEQQRSTDSLLREWAAYGLGLLEPKEAGRARWMARGYGSGEKTVKVTREAVLATINSPKNRNRIIWTSATTLERMGIARYPNYPRQSYEMAKRILRELCAEGELVKRPELHSHFPLKETAYMSPGDASGRNSGRSPASVGD